MKAQLMQITETEYADREETGPTCLHCGDLLDENRDSIGFCRDCEDEHEKARLIEEYWNEYAARKSQYHHLRRS